MKILFVGIPYSIHTARWINQLKSTNWDIFLFPSIMTNIVHKDLDKSVKVYEFPELKKRSFIARLLWFKWKKLLISKSHIDHLYHFIHKVSPDIIHSLESQHSGYLVSDLKNLSGINLDFKWWHTNWGSDIFLFGRLREHKDKIRALILSCDYYSCECERDVLLARELGYRKKIMPIYPNTGGFDLNFILSLKERTEAVTSRKIIMLKGYQGWAGRALVGLRALSLAKDIIKRLDLSVRIYSVEEDDVKIASELFSQDTGINVELIPVRTSHEEILKHHGEAIISIGLSISDAISTSVLEAMVMGSFPIQSDTSAAGDWFINGETGVLVPPEDPEIISRAIVEVLSDMDRLEKASTKNYNIISERLDKRIIEKKTIESYKMIMEDNKL